ncbi:SAM hydrolase/SAM-dependent halogenase family protein [Bailinhaonella thermotolerans]|uniref:SAM-dependent chlorinase/fluorinase n=1 Tax=Bailinhaonella thermotolerans TaxID=1070861 RepID=A0A3A4B6G9_9ACTN|nr:SAM-dependent chlorinase/fluorinase [Bailinhaonella thermotolerans]RJL33124.1 hypothetical protein D5H75_09730 [Bailinhaonella thermotolerans]
MVTPCISFLTDYGLEDGFVAACHGVIMSVSPGARVLDITHLVPPGDVRRGAAVLAQTIPHLPCRVHMAIVDPGVGTARRAIAVEAGDHVFLGPDNGLLSWAVAAAGGARAAYELTNDRLHRRPVSATFHGRDIFAPVAGHIAAGMALSEVGTPVPVDRLITLPAPTSRLRDGTAEGEVLCVDRFGNVQTSITEGDVSAIGAQPGVTLIVTLGRRQLSVPLRETFASVPPGELVAFADSAGLIALAVNAGDAAQRLGLPPGAHVRLAVAP